MFVIRSLPRTGTHLMKSALSGHPHLHCHTEIFHQNDWFGGLDKGVMAVLERHLKQPHHGFVVHDIDSYLQPKNRVIYDRLWHLLRLFTPPLINLHRRDWLRVAASMKIAAITKVWNQKTSDDELRENPSVELDWEGISVAINDHERFLKRTSQLFDWGHTVYYEDLVRNWDEEIGRVQRYLRVSEVLPIAPNTRKLDTRPIREIITNFDQVCSLLRKQGYERLIEIAEQYDEQPGVPTRRD